MDQLGCDWDRTKTIGQQQQLRGLQQQQHEQKPLPKTTRRTTKRLKLSRKLNVNYQINELK